MKYADSESKFDFAFILNQEHFAGDIYRGHCHGPGPCLGHCSENIAGGIFPATFCRVTFREHSEFAENIYFDFIMAR